MNGITANITYQSVTVGIALEYNSKNRTFTDAVLLDGVTSIALTKHFTDTVLVTDSLTAENRKGWSPADSIGLTDELSITMQYAPILGDTITLDDSNVTITLSSSLDFLLNGFMFNENTLN